MRQEAKLVKVGSHGEGGGGTQRYRGLQIAKLPQTNIQTNKQANGEANKNTKKQTC